MRGTRLICALVLGALACRPSAGVPTDSPAPADGPADPEPPASEHDALCSHSYEVLIAATGAGSPGVRDSFMQGCIGNAEAKREAMGEAAWSARVACILAGEDAVALGRCDGREPVVREPPSQPEVSQAEVCDRLIQLMVDEIGQGVIPEADLPGYRRRCAEEFEKAYAENPEEFNRQAACILDANSLSDIAGCEGL